MKEVRFPLMWFSLAALFVCGGLRAQTPPVAWTLYEYAGSALSPAMVLQSQEIELALLSRQQWTQLAIPFRTHVLRVQYPLLRILGDSAFRHRASFGLLFFNDLQGESIQLHQQSLRLSFAYQWQLLGSHLGVGIEAAWWRQRLSGEQITAYDPAGQPLQTEYLATIPLHAWAINMGLLWRMPEKQSLHQRYWVSVGAYGLNRPDMSFSSLLESRQSVVWQIAGEARLLPLRRDVVLRHTLSPTLYWSAQQALQAYQLGAWYRYHFPETAGKLFRYGSLGFGVRYHQMQRLGFLLAFNSTTLSLQFAYEHTLPGALQSMASLGSTDFSLSLRRTLGKIKKLYEREGFIINDDWEEIPEIEEIEEEHTDISDSEP